MSAVVTEFILELLEVNQTKAIIFIGIFLMGVKRYCQNALIVQKIKNIFIIFENVKNYIRYFKIVKSKM